MASPQHRSWLNRGGQWRLCTPGLLLRDTLRAAGYTVYELGNDAHLDHQPPEDHTPFSATGWPGTSPYGVVMAIDIMPPPPGRGLPSLQWLGAQLHSDKAAGRFPPIKYMNWGPVDDNHAVHCAWQPGHTQTGTTDTGHIHISFRTDMVDWSGSYNPLKTDTATEDDHVLFLATNAEGNIFYLCDGMISRRVNTDQIAQLRVLRDAKLINVAQNGGRSSLEFPFRNWSEAFGQLIATATDLAALASKVDGLAQAGADGPVQPQVPAPQA
ncbi:hypothetical protein AB0M46_50110 [Dactylosporangium sp. NPDC051485]|uniref:hypothetical protein n=1 Tax=Dactylosporangium sp. NPDC051485 TaxID=3154846 RepID=UPI00342ED56F